MKLFILTAAFFGVAFTSPTGPVVVGHESPIAPAADDVTQTRTVSNSAAVYGDFIQYIKQRNGESNYNARLSAINPANINPTSFTFRDVTQTSTMSNSGAVGGDLTQYIIHINGLTDGSRSINIAEKIVVNGNAPLTVLGPASVRDDASISEYGPMTRQSFTFRDVTQTSTLSNSGAVTGDLVQYIIHINGMTVSQIRNIADSVANEDDNEDAVKAGSKTAFINQLMHKIVNLMSVNGIESPETP